MSKYLAAAGLAALSAASLQAQYAPGLTPLEMSKAWALSADLRGFYDDNYLTEPHSFPNGNGGWVHPQSSYGVQISPSVAVNHAGENTTMSASYIYGETWYADHSVSDQSHQFNGRLDHAFSERYKLTLSESFVVAQEPTVLDPTVISTPLRVSGNNVHNTAGLDFTAGMTKNLDLHFAYVNSLYHYQQTQDAVIGYPFLTNIGGLTSGTGIPVPSRSALLDNMDQTATLDLRWKATPETTGIFGYEFEHVDYTSPEWIIFPSGPYINEAGATPGTPGYRSDIRNTDNDYVFVGLDASFTPALNGSIRVGAEYLDYYNYHTSRVSPYADASLTDTYLPGCTAQVGVKEIHNSTDVAGTFGTTPVLDEESTAVYISDSHLISHHLTATAMAQAQFSTFNGGGYGYNGESEQFYIFQLNVAYHFNPNVLTEMGYNYSNLRSDLPFRAYTRDFVYIGLRATY